MFRAEFEFEGTRYTVEAPTAVELTQSMENLMVGLRGSGDAVAATQPAPPATTTPQQNGQFVDTGAFPNSQTAGAAAANPAYPQPPAGQQQPPPPPANQAAFNPAAPPNPAEAQQNEGDRGLDVVVPAAAKSIVNTYASQGGAVPNPAAAELVIQPMIADRLRGQHGTLWKMDLASGRPLYQPAMGQVMAELSAAVYQTALQAQ